MTYFIRRYISLQTPIFYCQQVLKPVTAFVVIDVQNDFIDGKMALRTAPGCQEGLDVIPVINDLLDNVAFDLVVYSKDWHPENHISFINNVHLRDLHSSSKVGHGCLTIYLCDQLLYLTV